MIAKFFLVKVQMPSIEILLVKNRIACGREAWMLRKKYDAVSVFIFNALIIKVEASLISQGWQIELCWRQCFSLRAFASQKSFVLGIINYSQLSDLQRFKRQFLKQKLVIIFSACLSSEVFLFFSELKKKNKQVKLSFSHLKARWNCWKSLWIFMFYTLQNLELA